MDCRKLNSKVNIYHMVESVNPVLGTNEQSSVLLKTVWANVSPRTGSLLTGREAGTVLSKTTHAITVRSNALLNVTDSCYITWTDALGVAHKFDIDYVLPPNLNRFATIYCSEVVM